MFIRDRQTRSTVLVATPSRKYGGALDDAAPSLSADGRYLTFTGGLRGDDLEGDARVYLFDRSIGALTTIDAPALGFREYTPVFGSVVSGDGRYLACYVGMGWISRGGPDAEQEVFVVDRLRGTQEQVSVPTGGGSTQRPQLDNSSLNQLIDALGISADGRSVAFVSAQRGLVPDDVNAEPDVFVRDRAAGTTVRADVTREGSEGLVPAASYLGTPSGDGRYVTFVSEAQNLVPGDTNGVADVFVADRQAGTLERVSVSSAGEPGDQASGASILAGGLTISPDGRFVVFTSEATNLVPGGSPDDASIYAVHLYLRDRALGTTRRIDPDPRDDEEGFGPYGPYFPGYPVITPDGRFIAYEAAYETESDEWGEILLWDSRTGKTELVTADDHGRPLRAVATNALVSANGRYVAYDLTWSLVDTAPFHSYIKDRVRGTVQAIGSAAPFAGRRYDTTVAWMSADGGTVALLAGPYDGENESTSTYLWNWARGSFTRVALPADADSESWSADGRYVSYFDYVPSGPDEVVPLAYRLDRATGRRDLVSILPGQPPPGPDSDPYAYSPYDAWISADGQHVVWERLQDPESYSVTPAMDVYVRDFPTLGGTVQAPARVEFGEAPLFKITIRTVVVKNLSGAEALLVKAPTAAGPFAVLEGGGTTLVPPSDSLSLKVAFRPARSGPWAETLRIHTSDPRRPEIAVQLEGQGV